MEDSAGCCEVVSACDELDSLVSAVCVVCVCDVVGSCVVGIPIVASTLVADEIGMVVDDDVLKSVEEGPGDKVVCVLVVSNDVVVVSELVESILSVDSGCGVLGVECDVDNSPTEGCSDVVI